ncbi:MAG TPA: hypothetical protein VKX17_19215 [Planctomycetota bacterium]|nr:hypothetical protein [Planctomycetota bacterium]
MAYTHVNRRGQTYHLMAGKTARGRPHFYFTTKPKGESAASIPEGYEAYELPDTGAVVLRKKQPTRIIEFERLALENAIRTQAGLTHFVVEVVKDALIVHLSDMSPDDIRGFLDDMVPLSSRRVADATDRLGRNARYSKMMRFRLVSEQPRQFEVDRWCFLGGIDDWFPIGDTAPMAAQIKKFVKHLGKESFFELI